MEAMQAILTRRSIRKYTSEPLPEGSLEKLLKAAMSAPSAGNQQPWQFIAITERDVLAQIPSIHPYASMLQEAQAAILVCGDLELEKHRDFWVQDCSAATQNLLLAAHALGLGAVWVGVYPRSDRVAGLRDLLGLPEHVVPLALVSLGYPDEVKGDADRYDEKRVHRNRW
jgi:nitroreductase